MMEQWYSKDVLLWMMLHAHFRVSTPHPVQVHYHTLVAAVSHCRACSNRTRGNGFKVKEDRFRLDKRKKFFTMRVVTHCNRLSIEVVDLPSMEVFKVRLDGTLGNLV